MTIRARLASCPDCARQLSGLDVLFVGVRCAVEVIMARRNADPDSLYVKGSGVPAPVQRWQSAVHDPGIYDLEVDTSAMTPSACAARIASALTPDQPRTAFARLAAII